MLLPLLPQEIIRRKRDGAALTEAEIDAFIAGVTDGRVTEGQIAAFCMAVLVRGMTPAERVALTRAMTRSGQVLDWSAGRLAEPLGGPVLDKHATGGVGDKVSLVLAPLVAACGGFVPMLSGRGLGHTGGTLDKVDSIPGYVSQPSIERLRAVLRDAGCAIIGATDAIAPADRRIYAIRDVTATVESLDLITASILSKKLAAGVEALVLDVTFGSGAFARQRDQAEALAESLVTVARGAGLPAVALLSDMNQVRGHSAGNAVEVREACDLLTGRGGDRRLYQVTAALAAELLVLGGLAAGPEEARHRVDRALDSGAAAERFARMVTALGGPADFLDRYPDELPAAPVLREVSAEQSGFITAIDVRAVGLAVVALGGGRRAPDDRIDPAVGLTEVAGLGAWVGPDEAPLALVHARDEPAAEAAAARLRAAVTLGAEAPEPPPPVAGRMG